MGSSWRASHDGRRAFPRCAPRRARGQADGLLRPLALAASLFACLWASPLLAEELEPGAAAPTPAQRFRRAQNLFEFGDCAGAVPVLEGLDHPGTLVDEKQLVEVHRMLGVCYVLDGRDEDAVRQFEQLLYIDPGQRLDSFRTPPPVVELFDRVHASIEAKRALIAQAKRESEVKKPAEDRVVLIERERLVETTPFATVFLPFGFAQWANDELTKGLLIGGGQVLALGLNVASFWSLQALKADGARLPGERELHDVAQITQVAALVGFLGLYLYGVGDAWWNHDARREQVTQEARTELVGEEARRALRPLELDAE